MWRRHLPALVADWWQRYGSHPLLNGWSWEQREQLTLALVDDFSSRCHAALRGYATSVDSVLLLRLTALVARVLTEQDFDPFPPVQQRRPAATDSEVSAAREQLVAVSAIAHLTE